MTSGGPVILIASRSLFDRLLIERDLGKAGWSVRAVRDSLAAERVCSNGRASILVIDSGLLEAPHDPQWRELRSRHPELAAVVCCPTSRTHVQRTDRNTLVVHPSNRAGICDAIALLDSYRLEEMSTG
jgi:hypothetical protein